MIDGSDFPQQGIHAAGVKRQYCGELGKRAHCQAGVCGLSQPRRLHWAGSSAGCARRAAHRRCVCGTTHTVRHSSRAHVQNKPGLIQEMVAAVVKAQSLRSRWVVADEACGGHPSFLYGVAGLGL